MTLRLTRFAIPCLVAVIFPGFSACASDLDLQSNIPVPDRKEITGQEWHRGPDVFVAQAGPARFVKKLHEAFSEKRSMDTVRFTEGFYRAAANPAFDAVLDHIERELRTAGFGSNPNLRLEYLIGEQELRSWTPVSAELVLHAPGGTPRTLHSFRQQGDVDRVMLPINSPSADVRGAAAVHLEDLEPGMVLVTEVPLSQVLDRAVARGAAAVLSASLGTYNEDPSGSERHLDAIQYRRLRKEPALPVMQISPRVYATIAAACAQAEGSRRRVELELHADVAWEVRPLRTLLATIVGAEMPDESVAMGSHVQEPGACDNATGVAGLLESARSLAHLLETREIEWPARSLVFLWGDEFLQTSHWLDAERGTTIVGLSSDMTGQSRETGAIALLERTPDPGGVIPLAPDEHSLWGAGDVDEDDLSPNGLALVARCAMVDVGLFDGGWPCADHPWEGGSDHEIFFHRGIPAVLFWHFTDFTYHTSLDRLEFVDSEEMRRTAVALLSTALAVAAPKPSDLDRYLKSLSIEERVRVDAAMQADLPGLAESWKRWSHGSRRWLRNLCLGLDEPLPEVPAKPVSQE